MNASSIEDVKILKRYPRQMRTLQPFQPLHRDLNGIVNAKPIQIGINIHPGDYTDPHLPADAVHARLRAPHGDDSDRRTRSLRAPVRDFLNITAIRFLSVAARRLCWRFGEEDGHE